MAASRGVDGFAGTAIERRELLYKERGRESFYDVLFILRGGLDQAQKAVTLERISQGGMFSDAVLCLVCRLDLQRVLGK